MACLNRRMGRNGGLSDAFAVALREDEEQFQIALCILSVYGYPG